MTVCTLKYSGGVIERWCTQGVGCRWQLVSGFCVLILLLVFQGCATNYRGRSYRFSSEFLIHGNTDIPESYQPHQPQNDFAFSDGFDSPDTATIQNQVDTAISIAPQTDMYALADTFVINKSELVPGFFDRQEMNPSPGSLVSTELNYHVIASQMSDGVFIVILSTSSLNPIVRIAIGLTYPFARPYIVSTVEKLLYVLQ